MYAFASYDELGASGAAVVNAVSELTSVLEQSLESIGGKPSALQLQGQLGDAVRSVEKVNLRGIVRFGARYEVGDKAAEVDLQRVTDHLRYVQAKLQPGNLSSADAETFAREVNEVRESAIEALEALSERLARPSSQSDACGRAQFSSDQVKVAKSPESPVQFRNYEVGQYQSSQYQKPHSQGAPYRPVDVHPARTRPPIYPPPVPPKLLNHESSSPYSVYQSANTLSPDAARNSYSRYFSDQSDVQTRQHLPVMKYLSTSPATSISTTLTNARTLSSASASSVSSYPLNFITTTAYPSRSNNYLGFCKAAWKLQSGDEKAMMKAKDFTQSAQSKLHFLTCSKSRCEFKGRGVNTLTNRFITDASRGLKYRWTFLAKSHVFVKSDHEEKFLYLCMFCVFNNAQPIVMNLTALLNHISSEHCGRLSEVIRDRTHCIDSRICGDKEPFDINLFPVGRPQFFDSKDSTQALEAEPVELTAVKPTVELSAGDIKSVELGG